MQKCKMDYAKKGNGLCKNVKPIPDINTNNKPNNKPNIFKKPTLEEVKKYCSERNNNIDAEYFIDHYNSNGWKVGKNPMKDWKAAIRTWERRDKVANGNKQTTRKEIVPEWMNKEHKRQEATEEEKAELKELLKEFNPELEERVRKLKESIGGNYE